MPRHHHSTTQGTGSLIGFANPFCVLGLSVDADGPTIQQAAQRALMERRLGEQTKQTALEVELVEQALETLKDPLTRFTASIYWVTLNDDERSSWGETPRVQSLSFNDSSLSHDDYQAIASSSSLNVRTHNLAVLAYASAHRLAGLRDIPIAIKAWAKGNELWAVCLSSEEFVKRQLESAHILDDPRLTDRFVQDEVRAIPQKLLAGPATLAAVALQNRQIDDAVALVDLVRNAPFDAEFLDHALETIYRPLARRIETEIDSLDERRKEFVDSASESTNADELAALLEEFKDQVSPDLEQVLKLGDLPGLAEEHARDHASRFLEQLGLNAWNLADDSALAQEATGLASRYADARSLKNKLTKSLSQLADQDVLSEELEEIMAFATTDRAPEAIQRLRALKEKVSSRESEKFLADLIDGVSNNYAVSLFNLATQLMGAGAERSQVIEKLEEAYRWTTNSDDKAMLKKCVRKLRFAPVTNAGGQGLGCLLQIVVLVGIALLMGALRECN